MKSIKYALSSKGLGAVKLQRFATAWLRVLLPPKLFQALFQAEARTSNTNFRFHSFPHTSTLWLQAPTAPAPWEKEGREKFSNPNFLQVNDFHRWFLKYGKSRRAAWLVPLPREKKPHTQKKHLELHGFTAAMHSQDQLPRIVLTSAGTILGNPGFPVNKTPHLYFRDSKTQTTCRKTRLPGGLPKRKKYEIKN